MGATDIRCSHSLVGFSFRTPKDAHRKDQGQSWESFFHVPAGIGGQQLLPKSAQKYLPTSLGNKSHNLQEEGYQKLRTLVEKLRALALQLGKESRNTKKYYSWRGNKYLQVPELYLEENQECLWRPQPSITGLT